MNKKIVQLILSLAVVAFGIAQAVAEPLRLVTRTDVPGFEGDFDHFAADVKGNRLFLAGEEKGTLEIFDLHSGRHVQTVEGLEEPHAILYLPDRERLLITNSGAGLSKVLDSRTYSIVESLKLTPGADVMSYDPSTRTAWIVTGGKNAPEKMKQVTVAVIDPASGKVHDEIRFDTDFTEAIAFEQHGSRAFINVSGRDEIAVVDKNTRKVIATWPVKAGSNNAPMALDEANKRLFVVTRKPFRFVALDTDTGAAVATLEAPQRTNELVLDRKHGRVYLTGDDYISVIDVSNPSKYAEIARVKSDKGAKTAILVPEVGRLFVAVAGKGETKAGVLVYEVRP